MIKICENKRNSCVETYVKVWGKGKVCGACGIITWRGMLCDVLDVLGFEGSFGVNWTYEQFW